MKNNAFAYMGMGAVIVAASALFFSTAMAGVWSDDFEEIGLHDWVVYNTFPQPLPPIVPPDEGRWDERDGFLVGESNQALEISTLQLKPRSPHNVVTDAWNNYVVAVSARLDAVANEDDPGNTFFGVVLYDRRPQELYYVIVFEFEQDLILVGAATPDGMGMTVSPFDVGQGVWHRLTVKIETLEDSERIVYQVDREIPVRINNLWPDRPGGRVSSGGVALVVSEGRVSFDNFAIWGDSIPDGGPSRGLSVSPSGRSAQLWAELKTR